MLFARILSTAICEPKLRLGRFRHDGICDCCGEPIGEYAAEKLEFDTDSTDLETNTRRENLRVMLEAEYTRICFDCSVEAE